MVNEGLKEVLTRLGEEMKDEIKPDSEIYCLVDIPKAFEVYEVEGETEAFKDVKAIVPLKETLGGLNVEVDGTEIVDWYQLESGIVVKEQIAEESGLPSSKYEPKDSMILSFAK